MKEQRLVSRGQSRKLQYRSQQRRTGGGDIEADRTQRHGSVETGSHGRAAAEDGTVPGPSRRHAVFPTIHRAPTSPAIYCFAETTSSVSLSRGTAPSRRPAGRRP